MRLASPGRWRRALVVLGTCLAADVLGAAEPPAPLRFELGQTVLELGGEIRLRFEDDRAFDVRGYRPAIDDRFLLSRVMLDAEAWLGRPVRNRPERWPNASVPEPVVAAVYARALGLPACLDAFYVHKQDGSGQTTGEPGSGDLRSDSFGIQAEGSWKTLDYALTGVLQRGRWGQDRIRAGGASGTVGWRFETLPWRPRLRAVATWGSGDDDPDDGVHGTFDGVLGGADIAFYGHCNLFFWANLQDRELQLLLRPAQSLDVHVQAHSFALAASRDAWYSTSLASVRRDPSGASGRDLGRELDVRVVWRARRRLELMTGLAYFWPGAFIRQTGPARDARWLMLQATISR